MKFDWKQYIGKTVNVTMFENYGIQTDPRSNETIYEIVFKSGRLEGVYDEGLLIESEKEKEQVRIFIPHQSIKCVEIFNF